MTTHGLEVGFVSVDRQLADFYAEVFELRELDAIDFGLGTLYRLDLDGTILKVNVPLDRPEPGPRVEPFIAATGLRYLSIVVGDLDAVIDRATVRGARLLYGPMENEGERLVVLEDPDGNTIEVVQRS
jgi:catechol 2,3-dioxygenase-like lactoylglutathione lyase family enzyme